MKQYCELCGKDFESEVFCTVRIDKDDENWNSIDWETYTICPQCEQNLREYLKNIIKPQI